LKVLWATTLDKLPHRAVDAELPHTSTDADQFRLAMIRLWTVTNTWRKDIEQPVGGTGGREYAEKTSLASRAMQAYDEVAQRKGSAMWNPIQSKAVHAYWRVGTDGRLWLAMRYTLCDQVGVRLPGVTDAVTMTRLSDRYKVRAVTDAVTARLGGGVHLLVLSREITDELIQQPEPDPDPSDGQRQSDGC
jgi:hypothetical protein